MESFNDRLGQECLNENRSMSLANAQCEIETWRAHYKQSRPHSAMV
ncbi:integrase core domain-containing protein [Lonsdalea quercina]